MAEKLIRFDWAIKKLLRHKANFAILEGFLTELLGFDIRIESILESEGNQEDFADKYNKVDILVKSASGELMLVEVQNDAQVDYFQRMLYGASKLITEYITQGDPYGTIKKVFSINIVYFGLGQGDDYVYEYKGHFEGLHRKDILLPSQRQRDDYQIGEIADLFPKYYILKVNNFDDVARNTLDEWIYFLKNSEVKEGFKAKGLEAARERLREESLDADEKAAYRRYQENRRLERSVLMTATQRGRVEGLQEGIEKGLREGIEKGKAEGLHEGMEKGKAEGMREVIRNMHNNGLPAAQIAELTGLPVNEVQIILNKN